MLLAAIVWLCDLMVGIQEIWVVRRSTKMVLLSQTPSTEMTEAEQYSNVHELRSESLPLSRKESVQKIVTSVLKKNYNLVQYVTHSNP